MPTSPINSEHLKETASELAVLLSADTVDRQAVHRLLAKLGYQEPVDDPQLLELPTVSDQHVGIYKAQMINGENHYVRDIDLKEYWSFYADVQSIGPKNHKKRVVLLGESVARGFLLDPDYTPTHVLATLLQSRSDLLETEVIDLAETNLGMTGIKMRFTECLVLEPDVIVFLAGNNWRADLIEYISVNPQYYTQLSDTIQAKGGIGGVKPIMEGIFEAMVSSFLHTVGQVSRSRNIPVLFVIPEFNLLDFQSTPGEQFVAQLANDQIRSWVLARQAAEDALAAGNYDSVEEHANCMLKLDASHPVGFELLAKSQLRRHQYEEARLNLEAARDTALYCRTNSKPRIFSIIRNTILDQAPGQHLSIIDVPDLFRVHLDGKIPGRDLFLDYCHFTVTGIQIVAEAIAREVLQLLTGQTTSLLIAAESVKASPETIAMGHLFAAIHNAHWGQSSDILYHHCLQAVKMSKETHKIMIHYIDMVSRVTTNTLCKSFQQLMVLPKMDKYIHALIHPKNLKYMEADLVDAMVKALAYAGIEVNNYVNHLRQVEHSVNRRKINLLKSYYHSTSYDEYEGTKTAYFQARNTESRFILITQKNSPVSLDLTCRVPGLGHLHAEAVLRINEEVVSRIMMRGMWVKQSVLLPAEKIVEGINRIEISWPLPLADGSIAQGPALSTLTSPRGRSILDNAYHVFGEIYSFTAVVHQKGHPVISHERDLEFSN